ncbi:MAG: hypothetical protein KC978_07020 [Candidatus Omnitrophica bacterium]|nr:hypothetical protein [Candidatus Omnitrophota bacterium]
MKESLGLEVSREVEIRVCPLLQLSEKADDSSSPTVGAFDDKEGVGVLTIRPGLGGRVLVQVIAHEWTHAWQSENCPRGQDLKVHEGFAQWVTGELLRELGWDREFENLSTREDFYGEAYHWAAEFENMNGRAALFQFVKKAR